MEFAVGLRALCHSFELLCLSWSLNTKNIKDAQRTRRNTLHLHNNYVVLNQTFCYI